MLHTFKCELARMIINVGPEGDYRTVTEAIQATPYDTDVTINIAEGIYREKLHIEKKNITLIGAGPGKTVIVYGDGAKDIMPDGSKRGTFRSQTVFLGGHRCVVKDMTIENNAGTGMQAGQAVAVYADALEVVMERVELKAHQDTLFCAPLPTSVRLPGGFFGPRMLTERIHTRQYYRDCKIIGDIDFIFGGADAVFEKCEIVINDLGREINGYVTAPCENHGELGLVFKDCLIHGEHEGMSGSVFLGRPWRPTGKAAFINCRYDDSIHVKRFSEWDEISPDNSEAEFVEYAPTDPKGNALDISGCNSWVTVLSATQAAQLDEKINRHIVKITEVDHAIRD